MKAWKVLFFSIFSFTLLISCKGSQPTVAIEEPETLSTEAVFQTETVVKGTIALPQSGTLFIWSTYGKQVIKLDSAQISSGKFSFKSRFYPTGVYMLGTNENNMCPVIINEKDALCEVGFKTGKLETSAYAISSKENEGWFAYLPQETTLLRSIRDAKSAAYKTPDKKAHFEEQVQKKEAELLNLQNALIAQYPSTYFSKLLQWKQEPNKSDFGKYWDNIDFKDESIIRSKVLSERIESFMRTHSRGEESGFVQCVDAVANKAKANDAVLEFVLSQMLTGFYESGMEDMCAYIIDFYINGDACGDADLTQTIKNTAEGISKLAVGNVPPNFNMTDLNGNEVNLYGIASSKKYTLVMFWSSWCEHCKSEAPQVVTSYNFWKDKGLEIIGVSIDNNEQTWKSAVTERGFVFPSVCGMNHYRSPVAEGYRVTKTPSYFLLNDKKEIVLKPKSMKEAQTFLAGKLK